MSINCTVVYGYAKEDGVRLVVKGEREKEKCCDFKGIN
jgi:hypothetical protein